MSQQLTEGTTKFLWLLQALRPPRQLLLTFHNWHLHSILLHCISLKYSISLLQVMPGALALRKKCNMEVYVAFQNEIKLSCCLQVRNVHWVLWHGCKAAEDNGSYPIILHQLLSSPLACCHPSQQMERGIILGRRATEGAHSGLKITLQVQSKLQEAEEESHD